MKKSEEQKVEDIHDKQDRTLSDSDSRKSSENTPLHVRKWLLVAVLVASPIILSGCILLWRSLALFTVPIGLSLLLLVVLFLFLFVTAPEFDQ